jgi:hypothetical protein
MESLLPIYAESEAGILLIGLLEAAQLRLAVWNKILVEVIVSSCRTPQLWYVASVAMMLLKIPREHRHSCSTPIRNASHDNSPRVQKLFPLTQASNAVISATGGEL